MEDRGTTTVAEGIVAVIIVVAVVCKDEKASRDLKTSMLDCWSNKKQRSLTRAGAKKC